VTLFLPAAARSRAASGDQAGGCTSPLSSEPCRQGWGRALLERAERHARERGCRDAHLTSFSFQAPGFYRKQGYEEFGVLADFPPGHTHHFFRKRLGESAPVGDAPPAPERAGP
jgi:hypothetical protein